MEFFAYYLIFCVATCLALYAASRRHSSQRHWQLTPEIVMVLSFFLYTSAMPFSRILWGTESEGLDNSFIQTHILGIVGLLFGLILARLLQPPKAREQEEIPLTSFQCGALATIALFMILGYIYYSVGYSLANMLQPYTFEASLKSETTSMDTLIEPATFALILHCYLSASISRTRKPWLNRYVLSVAGLVTGALLLRGERNHVIILCLPMIAVAFRNRRIPVFKASAAAIAVFVLFSVVAVVRAFGLLSANSAPIGSTSMDPMQGELGTSYNVYSIYKAIASTEEPVYGKTYVVDLGINLIPHALWPNRPPSTAERFSMLFYGTENLTFGLGFSPVVEAMANFREPGIPFVFVAFAVGVVMLGNYLRHRGRWGELCYAMMLPMTINWNRIDSNTAFKMFCVYSAFLVLFSRLLYPPRPRSAIL